MSFKFGGREGNVAVVSAPAARTLMDEFPEVVDAVRFRQRGSFIVRFGDHSFKEQRVTYADPSFFRVFSIPLLKGSPDSALKDANTLVMSRTTAKKYFGEAEPVGQVVRINNGTDFMVTGVYEDIPSNSHFRFDLMVAMATLEESRDPSWLSQNFHTYIVLAEGADPKALEAKFPAILDKYFGPQVEKVTGMSYKMAVQFGGLLISMALQPLTDIHLKSDLEAEIGPTSDMAYVYIFTAIAVFILVIACINFMNLSTARASGRAKEVGVRKVMGSDRRDLVVQFLTESVLLSVVSLALSLVLVRLGLGLFTQLSGKDLRMADLATGPMIAALFLVTVSAGLLAGAYPAFVISAFRPANVLRGQVRTGLGAGRMRSALVVFQFAASVVLIVGTLVVRNQLRFMQSKDLGFDKDQIMILEDSYLLGPSIESFKNEMLTYPGIESATVSGYLPVPSNRNQTTVFPGTSVAAPTTTSIQCWVVDYDYIRTLGMTILQGRDFSRDFSTDTKAVVINEEAVKQYQFAEPLGQILSKYATDEGALDSYTVVGVVKNFHFDSLRSAIEPLMMYLGESPSRISFRVGAGGIPEGVKSLERTWKKFMPDQPLNFGFMDEKFDELYRAEQRIGRIFGVFAGLALFIGCLGLFGLASYVASRRTKEIGIRKVLGASEPGIVGLLMKEFLLLVGLANVLAAPAAYFFLNKWLGSFAYRARIDARAFVAAAAATVAIAALTVSYRAMKAAATQPVDCLRYE
jgi:putative ABC transport system permease protein